MTLFEHQAERQMERDAPLAARMRPRTFGEFVGQEHIVGPGRALRKGIEADRIPSMVLWGPPGSGKTTVVHLIPRFYEASEGKITLDGTDVRWALVIKLPLDVVMAEFNQLDNDLTDMRVQDSLLLAGIGLLVALAGLVVMVLLAYSLAKPARQLVAMLDDIAAFLRKFPAPF